MEYVQMTLNDWVEIKQKLKRELLGIKQSFVRIGFVLRQIDDQKLYERDGYKSIADFAKQEYGLEPSTTSRFMSINREYSIDGYSETLRPEYADLGRSQLEEMLKLPDGDRQMVQPETSRENIRELKRFNKEEPEEGIADDLYKLVENFYKDNPDILNEVFKREYAETDIKQFIELVNPAGNRSYKKGMYFLMMYENRVAIKRFGESPQNKTWWEFYQITRQIFEMAAGEETWKNYFGEEIHGENQEEIVNPETKENITEYKVDEKYEEAPKIQTSEQKKEEIAPAQKQEKSFENEQEIITEEQIEGQMDVTDYPELLTEEMKEDKLLEEQPLPADEIVTRKEYLNSLTEHGAADYLHKYLKVELLADREALEKWFEMEVDKKWGIEIEQI